MKRKPERHVELPKTTLAIDNPLREQITDVAMKWLSDKRKMQDLIDATGTVIAAAAGMWTANADRAHGEGTPLSEENFMILVRGCYSQVIKERIPGKN